ncbi:hypothetical protein [Mesorhizobium delmotii]|uniref:Uncharacterized protein n=1 Tax=Mesorhizobium delmotii TaxID=1631247 RepID=A0A2P9AQ67_9HYPH|nr:hypothetical protein [Mesorhizobium delmotii]SJM33314.1 hypothetical protein BQ8482_340210 [Mesorhizobium delmotii]
MAGLVGKFVGKTPAPRLLNEHETTRLIETALTECLKVSTPADDEPPQLAQNVDPQAVMSQIEQVSENLTKR